MKTAQDSDQKSTSHFERRRHTRYRYSVPFTIRRVDGREIAAISFEISESGLSALSGDKMNIGEQVELDPIGGGKITAVIRHANGKLYGFEFVNPSREQVRNIKETCQMLPRFYTRTLSI